MQDELKLVSVIAEDSSGFVREDIITWFALKEHLTDGLESGCPVQKTVSEFKNLIESK